jgi:FlaA1/EpsC-like NDP-sugar epimerase
VAARVVIRIALGGQEQSQDYQPRRRRTVLIGANRLATAFIQLLQAYSPNQQTVIAVLDDDKTMVGRAIGGVEVMGAPHELDAIIAEFAVHGVVTEWVVI